MAFSSHLLIEEPISTYPTQCHNQLEWSLCVSPKTLFEISAENILDYYGAQRFLHLVINNNITYKNLIVMLFIFNPLVRKKNT